MTGRTYHSLFAVLTTGFGLAAWWPPLGGAPGWPLLCRGLTWVSTGLLAGLAAALVAGRHHLSTYPAAPPGDGTGAPAGGWAGALAGGWVGLLALATGLHALTGLGPALSPLAPAAAIGLALRPGGPGGARACWVVAAVGGAAAVAGALLLAAPPGALPVVGLAEAAALWIAGGRLWQAGRPAHRLGALVCLLLAGAALLQGAGEGTGAGLLGAALQAGAWTTLAAGAVHLLLQDRALAAAALLRASRLAVVGELGTGAVHRFNNLLGTITLRTQLAAQRVAEGGSPERDLQVILHSSAQAAEMMRRLLALARGKPGPHRAVDLEGAVAGALEALRLTPRLAQVEVDLAVPPGALVLADPDSLEQVLLMLVLDATAALPGGGDLRFDCLEQGGCYHLLISAGPAPDPAVPAADPGAIPDAGRTVAVSRDLARAMGGDLLLRGGAGSGHAFILRLPRAPGSGARSVPPPVPR